MSVMINFTLLEYYSPCWFDRGLYLFRLKLNIGNRYFDGSLLKIRPTWNFNPGKDKTIYQYDFLYLSGIFKTIGIFK